MMKQDNPLAVLARKLQAGPPSIHYLLGLLEHGESLQGFVAIVREFLPDHEAAIMANGLEGRIQAFVGLFNERYFPLHESVAWGDDPESGYYDLILYIPIPRLALSWDDLHEISDFKIGIQLIMAVVANPYGEYGDGLRVPLLEQCANLVGKELVKRIPQEGWEPEELHRLLDDTTFVGAAHFGDCLWRNTDTVFLDVDWEEDLSNLDWSRENVEYLTQRWPRVLEIQDRAFGCADWLEENPRVHFGLLLDALGAKAAPGKTLLEVFTGGDDDDTN